MVPACQKETEIFVVEGTLSYVNYAVRRRNFAVLWNSVNSPATHIQKQSSNWTCDVTIVFD